jgi:hypothetical protein
MIAVPMLVAALVAAEPDAAERAAAAAAAAERAAAAAEKAAVAAAAVAEAAARAAHGLAVVPAKATLPPETQAAKPAAPPPSRWTANAGLGFLSLTGNARTVSFNTTASAERKGEDWILAAKIQGTYGRSRSAASAESEVIAQGAGLTLRVDRRFAARYSTYLLAGVETDRVKSVEARETSEAGFSIVWTDPGDAKVGAFLRTDVGFRVAWEQRHQYYPVRAPLADETLYAPRAGATFRYRLSPDVVFSEEAEVLPSVSGDSRVLATSVTRLQTRLSRSLGVGTAFTVAHDSAPSPGKVPTDTSLALTLEVLF